MPTETNSSKKITVKCSKCGGAGKISGYAHVSSGVCFDCEGTGTMSSAITNGQRMKKVERLMSTATIVLEAAEHGNEIRADHYADMMIDDLFVVGTDAARKVLDYIGAGQYRDFDTCDKRSCSVDAAARCRTYIIAQGRARRAVA